MVLFVKQSKPFTFENYQFNFVSSSKNCFEYIYEGVIRFDLDQFPRNKC